MGDRKRGVRRRRNRVPAACPTGKRSYVTRERARHFGRIAQSLNGAPFDVYRCETIYGASAPRPGCGQYHLTTRRERRTA